MIAKFKSKPKAPQTTASAKVVDGKLILTFPDALTPVVWQMDLAHAKASALEVLEDKKKGEKTARHTLTLKTPKGESIEVAAFTARADAVEGLMRAASALENAHGQIREGTNYSAAENKASVQITHPAKPGQKRNKWIGAILGLIILFVLFNIWSAVTPVAVSIDGSPANNTRAATSNNNPATSSGVPVSADDFLNAQ